MLAETMEVHDSLLAKIAAHESGELTSEQEAEGNAEAKKLCENIKCMIGRFALIIAELEHERPSIALGEIAGIMLEVEMMHDPNGLLHRLMGMDQ